MFGFGSSWKDAAEDSLRELRGGDGSISPIQKLIDAAPEPEAFHREYPSAVEDAELDKWWRENVVGRPDPSSAYGLGDLVYVCRDYPPPMPPLPSTPYILPASIPSGAIPPNPDLSSLFPGESGGLNSQTMLLLAGAMALFMMKR